MRKIFKLLIVIAAISIIACGDSDDSTNPTLTGNVTITGTAEVGQELTANVSGHNAPNEQFNFQWQKSKDNAPFVAIAGATQKTYQITAEEVDHILRAVVTHNEIDGEISSDPTEKVPEFPNVYGIPVTGPATPAHLETIEAGFDELATWGVPDESNFARNNINEIRIIPAPSHTAKVIKEDGKWVALIDTGVLDHADAIVMIAVAFYDFADAEMKKLLTKVKLPGMNAIQVAKVVNN